MDSYGLMNMDGGVDGWIVGMHGRTDGWLGWMVVTG